MRDGNTGTNWRQRCQRARSEPTYEGWKPSSLGPMMWCAASSEPTYEGWKPDLMEDGDGDAVMFRAYL